jgi:hypothetical protein
MGLQSKNFEALYLTAATYTSATLGDGITANTVHQLYCISAGTVTISCMGGGVFTWAGTVNAQIEVVPKQLVVNSGEFVAFRTKGQERGYGLYT